MSDGPRPTVTPRPIQIDNRDESLTAKRISLGLRGFPASANCHTSRCCILKKQIADRITQDHSTNDASSVTDGCFQSVPNQKVEYENIICYRHVNGMTSKVRQVSDGYRH